MACLIKGCNFLLKNIPDEAFVYQRHGNPEYKFQTVEQDAVYPYLLVNIGSGVSILKVSRTISKYHIWSTTCNNFILAAFLWKLSYTGLEGLLVKGQAPACQYIRGNPQVNKFERDRTARAGPM